MLARLIAYPPDAAAVARWLDPATPLRIGRDPDCGLVIEHPSVSRHHAELHFDGEAWRLRDLGSKNGSFVDGIAVNDHRLPRNCWLRLGDSYCDFGLFVESQAAAMRERQSERRAMSQAMAMRMSRGPSGTESLPAHVLRGVIELSGCTRGFMLLADPGVGDFTVCASLQLDPSVLDTRAFSGSVGAVQRVLTAGKALVVNDIGNEGWLSGRESVVASGLTTLVCLPLLDRGKVFGAVYADRRGPGEPITDFDLELLAAFAESATLYLLTRRAMQSLSAPRWKTILEHQHALTSSVGAAP
ncbi:FHA domain-containing protein [Lysobacter fragariae]